MKNSTSGAGTSTDGCSSTKTRLFCCQKWKCKVCSWRCLLSTVQLLDCEGDSLSLSPSDYRWREHQRRTFQMKTASSFLHRHRSGEKWLQSADDRSTEKDWSHSPWTEDRGLRLSSGLGSGLLMSDLFPCLCRVFRAAMTSIQQLRGDLISTGDTPSTTLTTYFKVSEKKRFLLKRNSFKIKTSLEKKIFFLNLYKLLIQNCTVDPTQGVLKRLEMLDQRFSQRFGQAVGPRCVLLGNQVKKKKKSWGLNGSGITTTSLWDVHVDQHFYFVFQRFTLGVRLYYKVMEAMLKSVRWRLRFTASSVSNWK